jgi:hypothetical protein
MRKLEVESWEELMAAELTAADSVDEPEEALPECDELLCERAIYRWELDPAWAEDYHERYRPMALKWRHWGH